MSGKTKTVMAALFFFGSASAVLADTDNRTDHHESAARRAVSVTMSNRRESCREAIHSREQGRVGLTQARLRTEYSVVSSWHRGQHDGLDQIDRARREAGSHQRGAGNVRQICTQILGARAQIDLASGKFQGVQENVDQVMQLIMAAAGARANDECA
jgi:hypothetical protein